MQINSLRHLEPKPSVLQQITQTQLQHISNHPINRSCSSSSDTEGFRWRRGNCGPSGAIGNVHLLDFSLIEDKSCHDPTLHIIPRHPNRTRMSWWKGLTCLVRTADVYMALKAVLCEGCPSFCCVIWSQSRHAADRHPTFLVKGVSEGV
jgi:hypothetical protein